MTPPDGLPETGDGVPYLVPAKTSSLVLTLPDTGTFVWVIFTSGSVSTTLIRMVALSQFTKLRFSHIL